jgi:antirestriction protein ArdC
METPQFAALLRSAVEEPGIISRAYTAFHAYSLGNQLLAWGQCATRGIPPGPIATFMGWKDKGRHVRKGERALTLCMPVTVKRQRDDDASDSECFTRFVFRNNWFVLAQTDGEPLTAPAVPSWDRARALAALNISDVPFDLMNGNVQGFARERAISVSPVAALPFKTTFHEMAHVLLGHTSEGEQADSDITPRSLRECEAECVALLCCAALDLPGVAEARGYVQHWHGTGNPIPERSAQKILKVADQILRAGRNAAEAGVQ